MANFQNIRLEKGMYQVPGGICAALEQADPSENYKGTSLEGLDAFQRQLKRFDIKVMGRNSDPVAKFFSTSDSSVLFPEYISRTVRTGMEEADILGKLIATVTKIDSLDYRLFLFSPTTMRKNSKLSARALRFPPLQSLSEKILYSFTKEVAFSQLPMRLSSTRSLMFLQSCSVR